MPSKESLKSLAQVVDEVGVYPPDAYLFVQQGLNYTVQKIHANTDPEASHHIGGKELCHGLCELALKHWGMLAPVVLTRWNITTTMDFGRIVFAMVDHELLQKTDEDSIEDFRQVFDFRSVFEANYTIDLKADLDQPKKSERKS